MEHENKKEQDISKGGFGPAPTNEVGDWGNSDGFSLWNSEEGAPEGWLDSWEGRQETHDMIHDSYD